ncbi:MAG: phage holin family protein, partial [Burkholderiaceae bacterium]|nr:phage holin family protein [Burkholderiaceae bacterium]
MRLLAIWLINALALLSIPYLMHSVAIDSFGTALLVALVL